MVRSLLLTFWELRRLLRSKRAVAAEFTLPVLGIIACIIFHGHKYVAFRWLFPEASLISSWLILYVRSTSDRGSGFAAGVESSPAEGPIAFTARILTGLTLILVQSIVFFSVVLLIFR